MGYHLNCLDEPVFMAGPKHIQAEFGNHQRLESCGDETKMLTKIPFLLEFWTPTSNKKLDDDYLPNLSDLFNLVFWKVVEEPKRK